VRSGSEEIRQSNCNAYINSYADLYASSQLALLTNTYTSVYSCVLFILASVVTPAMNMEVDPTPIPLPEDNPQQPQQRDIKLLPFWTTRPRAWFTFVESWFRLRGIEEDQSRFDHVLSALPAEMISQVIDIVDTMPAEGLYEHFKNQLLEVQQLLDYEKFDVLIKMEPMGGQKPSQLLHAMLEFCPVGMEKHLSFHYLYMQRLPQVLRTQLGEVQAGDLRGLAARADRLWSVQAPSGGVAAVMDEQDGVAAVAAVKPAARGRGRGGGRGGQQATVAKAAAKTAASGGAGAAGTPAADPTPSDLARMSSGLCFFHWAFADKASKCVPPCMWGN
jgi:hypothetical protein